MSDMSLSPADVAVVRADLFTNLLRDVESLLTEINDVPGEWSLNRLFDRITYIHEEYSSLDPVPPS